MELKIRDQDATVRLFYLLWIIYNLMFFYFRQTELFYRFDTEWIYKLTSLGVTAVLFLMILLKRTYPYKQFLVYAVIGAGLVLAVLMMRDKYLMVATGFILMAPEIDFKSFLRMDLKLKLWIFITVILMSKLGLIANFSSVINGTRKQALGFSHPNVMAGVFIVILLEYLYLRYERLQWTDHVLVVAGILWINYIAASRSNLYTFIVIYILLIVSRRFPDFFCRKGVIRFIALMPVIFTGISFLLVRLYEAGNAFALKLNAVLTNRLMAASVMLADHGLSPFGQIVNTRGTRSVEVADDAVFSVDMSYIRMPIVYGIFITILILVGYYFFVCKAGERKNVKLMLSILFFVLLGFGESYFFRMQFNFTLPFVLMYINEKKSEPVLKRKPVPEQGVIHET